MSADWRMTGALCGATSGARLAQRVAQIGFALLGGGAVCGVRHKPFSKGKGIYGVTLRSEAGAEAERVAHDWRSEWRIISRFTQRISEAQMTAAVSA